MYHLIIINFNDYDNNLKIIRVTSCNCANKYTPMCVWGGAKCSKLHYTLEKKQPS